MNRNDNHETSGNGDDFWGSTPDWTDSADRPRRQKRSERSTDFTGAIKGLWNSAMSAGVAGTREHRALDATAPRPIDSEQPGIDAAMFDDLDTDFETSDPAESINATTEIPVIDATAVRDDEVAAFAPVTAAERRGGRVGSARSIDPLLARIGAVAIVTTLLIPLAIGLSSGGDDDTIASADPGASSALVVPAATAAEFATATASNEQPEFLDPDSLPPAVPVNPTSSADGVEVEKASSTVESSTTESADETTTSTDASEVKASESTTDSTTEISTESSSGSVTEAASAGEDAERVSNCAVDYTIVVGDFWLRLADATSVPLAELLEANGATVNTALYPGSTICLPAGSATPAPPTANNTPATTAPATTTPATTTAPPTTSAPTPPTTVVSNTSATPEEVQQIIRDVWPDELEERALEIAFRESRYVPTAKNFCCYGIFQIYWTVHDVWLVDIGITDDQQLYDPATNARAAYALYQRAGGWGPWTL
jgi:hypothetical protein